MSRKSHLLGWSLGLNLLLVGLLVMRAQSEGPVVAPESVPQSPPVTTQLASSSKNCPYCNSSIQTFHYSSCPVEELNRNVQDTKRAIRNWATGVKNRAEQLGRPRGRNKCLFCDWSIRHSALCPLERLVRDAERLESATGW